MVTRHRLGQVPIDSSSPLKYHPVNDHPDSLMNFAIDGAAMANYPVQLLLSGRLRSILS